VNNEDFLKHYGILGMRWGRRKGTTKISKLSKASNTRNVSEDHTKKVTLKKKKLYDMSNAELRALNERLQLERSYKDLMKADISPAKKFVRDLLTDIVKDSIKSVVKDSITGDMAKNKYSNGFLKAKELVNLARSKSKASGS
jgi:hypothetical protein